MKAEYQKGFILGSPLGQGPAASTNEQLEDAIYALKVGEVTKTPVKIGDNWYIAGVSQRTEASMDDFAKQRDDLMEQFLNRKRGEVFADYMAATRQKLEAGGDIKVYDDVIAKLEDDALPGLPGGDQ